MRSRTRPVPAAVVVLVALTLGGGFGSLTAPAAATQPDFEVHPGSAEPGELVDLSGDGCTDGARAQAALTAADGAAVGAHQSFVPDATGRWSGAFQVPEGAEAGEGYSFSARCLGSSGEVLVEYPDVGFTVVAAEPSATPTASTTSTSTSSATPSATPSKSPDPTPSSTRTATSTASPSPVGSPRPSTDPLRRRADDVVQALERGNLAFRPPQEMREGVAEELVIQVRRPSVPGDPASGLPGQGPPVVVPVEVSTSMTAELTGSAFDVEPSGPQRRTLTSTFPAEWRWTVTPTSFGTSTLRLRLAVVLSEDPDTPLIPQVTYDEEIRVRVHPVHTAVRLLKTVQGALTATGLTAAAVAGALWQLWRRRRSASGATSPAAGARGAPPPRLPRPRRSRSRRRSRVAGPR